MKTFTKSVSTVVAALLISASTAALAVPTKPVTVSTKGVVSTAGNFSETFYFTTGDSPGEILYATGLIGSFSALSLDIFSTGGTELISGPIAGVVAKDKINLKATFNQTMLTSMPALAPKTTYKAVVTGTALSDGVSFTVAGNVAAIPEPGEWALMLSGLGLMGAVARRRGASRSA